MTYYLTRQIELISDGPESGRILAMTGPQDVKVARLPLALKRVTKTEFRQAPEFDIILYGWDGTFTPEGRAVYREVRDAWRNRTTDRRGSTRRAHACSSRCHGDADR